MTTKVLIVNHGPDPVLVRTVDYGPVSELTGVPANVIADDLLPPQNSREFYVHLNQQLMVGEKRSG